jgi:hypothetical protein
MGGMLNLKSLNLTKDDFFVLFFTLTFDTQKGTKVVDPILELL